MRLFSRAGILCTVVSGFIAGSFSPVAAQSLTAVEPGSITATPFLSVGFGVSDDLDSSLSIGGAIGYDLTRNLGFEFDVSRLFDVVGDNDDVDWSVTNITGNVLYHFAIPRQSWVPYGAFGIGWERSSPDYDDPDPLALRIGPSTEVVWNIGGGVKVPLTERFVARGDLRRFQSNDTAPDFWRLAGGLTFWIKR